LRLGWLLPPPRFVRLRAPLLQLPPLAPLLRPRYEPLPQLPQYARLRGLLLPLLRLGRLLPPPRFVRLRVLLPRLPPLAPLLRPRHEPLPQLPQYARLRGLILPPLRFAPPLPPPRFVQLRVLLPRLPP